MMNTEIYLILTKDAYLLVSMIGLSIIMSGLLLVLWFVFKPLSALKRMYMSVVSIVNEIVYFFIEAVSTIRWLDKFFKEP